MYVYTHTEFSLAEMFDLMTYAMSLPSLKFHHDFRTSAPFWVMLWDEFPFYSCKTFGQNSSNPSESPLVFRDGPKVHKLSDLHPDVAQNEGEFCKYVFDYVKSKYMKYTLI